MQPAKLYTADCHIKLTQLWTEKLKMNDCPCKCIQKQTFKRSRCTICCVQHAGATLPTAHASDCRSQVHPGPSVLGSGRCHIWRDTVFWGRTESDGYEQPTNIFTVVILQQLIRKDHLYACVPAHLPRGKQQVEAGAAVGVLALHGRGSKRQTRKSRSFGRNGWSSNLGSAGSELVLHWARLFCAVSPHPLMQKTCLL